MMQQIPTPDDSSNRSPSLPQQIAYAAASDYPAARRLSLRTLFGATGQLAKDSKQRASVYVSTMESYLGHTFSPKVQFLAMAAVSGIAISTAMAARAGTIGAQNNVANLNIRERDTKLELANLKKKYDELLNSNKGPTVLDQQDTGTPEKTREDNNVPKADKSGKSEAVKREYKGQIAVLEQRQKEAEELIAVAVSKITRLENELETTRQTHAHELKHREHELRVVSTNSDAKSVQLQAIQDTADEVTRQREGLQNFVEDLNARIEARDKELKITRDQLTQIEVEYKLRLHNLDGELSEKHDLVKNQSEMIATKVAEIERWRTMYTEREKSLEEMRLQFEDLQVKFAKSEEELAHERSTGKILETEYAAVKKDLEDVKSQRTATSDQALQSVQAELDHATASIRNLESKLQELTLQKQSLLEEVSGLRASKETLESEHEIALVKQQEETESAQVSMSAVNTELSETKKLLQRTQTAASQAKSELEAKTKDSEQNAQAIERQLTEMQTMQAKYEVSMSTANSELSETKKLLQQIQTEASQAKSELEAKTKDSEHQKQAIERQRTDMQTMQAKHEVSMSVATTEFTETKKMLQQHQTETSEAKSALAAQTKIFEQKTQAFEMKHAASSQELQDLRGEMSSIKSTHEEAKAKDSAKRQALQKSIEADMKTAETRITELEKSNSNLLAAHKREIENLHSLNQSELQDYEDSKSAELDYVKGIVDSSRAEIKKLQASLESSKASRFTESSDVEMKKLQESFESSRTSLALLTTDNQQLKASLEEALKVSSTKHESQEEIIQDLREQLTSLTLRYSTLESDFEALQFKAQAAEKSQIKQHYMLGITPGQSPELEQFPYKDDGNNSIGKSIRSRATSISSRRKSNIASRSASSPNDVFDLHTEKGDSGTPSKNALKGLFRRTSQAFKSPSSAS